MDNVTEGKLAMDAKPVDQGSESKAVTVNKFVANRIANKQRKKLAHRRKLRRPHTKG